MRRGDGLVVLDRKITRKDHRFHLTVVLPIGNFHIDATSPNGSHFGADIHVTPEVEALTIPRTK